MLRAASMFLKMESAQVSAEHAKIQYATLAQLVEQCFRKAEVPGSIPGGGSVFVEKDTEVPKAWGALRASHALELLKSGDLVEVNLERGVASKR